MTKPITPFEADLLKVKSLPDAESVEIIFEKIPDHLLKLFVEELKISFPESRILHKLQSN